MIGRLGLGGLSASPAYVMTPCYPSPVTPYGHLWLKAPPCSLFRSCLSVSRRTQDPENWMALQLIARKLFSPQPDSNDICDVRCRRSHDILSFLPLLCNSSFRSCQPEPPVRHKGRKDSSPAPPPQRPYPSSHMSVLGTRRTQGAGGFPCPFPIRFSGSSGVSLVTSASRHTG